MTVPIGEVVELAEVREVVETGEGGGGGRGGRWWTAVERVRPAVVREVVQAVRLAR
ncbi:hypothetical protein AB0912_12100 [Streptomyces sp. NPDC007084]|uniref:hypothetical protein n=1 Tax=Streptomyces sp. NPDC007084 TaxID=3154313 RepID=UPI003455009E